LYSNVIHFFCILPLWILKGYLGVLLARSGNYNTFNVDQAAQTSCETLKFDRFCLFLRFWYLIMELFTTLCIIFPLFVNFTCFSKWVNEWIIEREQITFDEMMIISNTLSWIFIVLALCNNRLAGRHVALLWHIILIPSHKGIMTSVKFIETTYQRCVWSG